MKKFLTALSAVFVLSLVIAAKDAPPPGAEREVQTTAAQATATQPTVTETETPADATSESGPAPSVTATTPTTSESEAADGASALLAGLEVKGKAPRTGYEREEFGQRWSDDVTVEFGHNGCDTRNDILRRDLRELEVRPGTHGYVAQSGLLDEPYTGEVRRFDRGTDEASRIHIDHVVALANAWETGAQFWDAETRRNFANDPRNLLAVDGSANQSKGAGDAATWQPPNKAFRCDYATRQVEVKAAYGLWVTPAEKDALERELGRCPSRAAAP